ncbi:cytochrome P450 [Actinomadura rayongensis]|uniref:Cytochrome P450 n=1 Tax=Actinomadura rayongensis TaxID=1429076 RepID=A0A6I4VZV1_9ACTN|nr:cytochrome P450 [Actinomadura rayongensis]MXQ63517.1 cytochrome P450 [Actinomadura rayongensis]
MTALPEPLNYPFNKVERLEFDPGYAEARARDGLTRVQLPFGEPTWLVTRYEDVKSMLSDTRFSRQQALGEDEARVLAYTHRPDTLLNLDPPVHTRLRRVVSRAFSQRRMERLRPRIQAIADDLFDELRDKGGPADLFESLFRGMPTMVICELLGADFADRHAFHQWGVTLASTASAGTTPEDIARADAELRAYLGELAARKREEPGEDLMTVLVESQDGEDPLTEKDVIGLAWSVLLAGIGTTTNMMANSAYLLLTLPEHFRQLKERPDLVEPAVEEMLRHTPFTVSAMFPRRAVVDVELGGTLVRAGETVLASLMAANRDESVFEDPDRLDFTRANNPHLAFSHGIHHCLGSQLARTQLQVMIHGLVERFPGLRLVPDQEIPWRSGVTLRGPAGLVVDW